MIYVGILDNSQYNIMNKPNKSMPREKWDKWQRVKTSEGWKRINLFVPSEIIPFIYYLVYGYKEDQKNLPLSNKVDGNKPIKQNSVK